MLIIFDAYEKGVYFKVVRILKKLINISGHFSLLYICKGSYLLRFIR